MKKTTIELMEILKHSDSIEDFLEQNADQLVKSTIAEELTKLVEDRGIKPADLFRRAAIERTYGYEILAGKKHCSRDKVLALLFALNVPADEIQRILKSTGYPPLYAKAERDSVILFALQRNISLVDTNELLYDMNLPTL